MLIIWAMFDVIKLMAVNNVDVSFLGILDGLVFYYFNFLIFFYHHGFIVEGLGLHEIKRSVTILRIWLQVMQPKWVPFLKPWPHFHSIILCNVATLQIVRGRNAVWTITWSACDQVYPQPLKIHITFTHKTLFLSHAKSS